MQLGTARARVEDSPRTPSRLPALSHKKTAIMAPAQVVLVAVGSRGDVEPFARIGARLQAAGIATLVLAHAEYADLVRRPTRRARWSAHCGRARISRRRVLLWMQPWRSGRRAVAMRGTDAMS